MTTRQDTTMRLIQQFIHRRFEANAVTLEQFYSFDGQFLTVDPALLRFMQTERTAILEAIRFELDSAHVPNAQVILHTFVLTTQKFIYQHNQFVALSSAQQSQLTALYNEFLAAFAHILQIERTLDEMERLIRSAFKDHLRALREFFATVHRSHAVFQQQVVCSEYSASFQLNVLGIQTAALAEPILDIGCGERGQLVGYLRGLGLDAFGIDRVVTPSAYLLQADWLHIDLQEAGWGTIISHMAFSNHFIFHHLYANGSPQRYAQTFMKALSALKIGGKFHYAPGLPFIEPLLPASSYAVSRRTVRTPQLTQPIPPTEAELVSESASYATTIIRMA